MKWYKTVILITALATLLSSCGTQIQMTEAVPASVCLGRDTTMQIMTYGTMDRLVENGIREKLVADGFYKLPGPGVSRGIAFMKIKNTRVEEITRVPFLVSEIDISNRYQTLYHKVYGGPIGLGGDPRGAVEAIARTVARDITPHEKRLYVRVRGSKENPAVRLGALACKNGNWERGEAYAKAALQKASNDPEALFLMGVIERNKMNYARSSYYFSRANAIRPSSKYKAAIIKNKVMATNDKYVTQQLSS